MHDYQQILTELQQKMARKYLEDAGNLNHPGISTACKIDPFYYLVLQPSFINTLTQWSGFSPSLIEETLVKTGNLLRLAGRDTPFVSLGVKQSENAVPVRVNAGFIMADYIDKGLAIYARIAGGLPISGLVINKEHREALHEMFEGKTQLSNLAFG